MKVRWLHKSFARVMFCRRLVDHGPLPTLKYEKEIYNTSGINHLSLSVVEATESSDPKASTFLISAAEKISRNSPLAEMEFRDCCD